MLASLVQDLRFAVRQLLRAPGFAAVAILTLGLGVGANTAIFSVVHGVLLRPLPFPEPEQLVSLWHRYREEGSIRAAVTPGNFEDWRAQSTAFESMAGYWRTGVTLETDAGAERLIGVEAVGPLFETLHVAPLAGRVMSAEETHRDAERVTVLATSTATRLFGSPEAALGRSLRLGGQPYAVIGVMPASFRFPDRDTELWLPGRFSAELEQSRTESYLAVVARLRPEATLAGATAEMEAIAARLRAAFPEANGDVEVTVEPLLASWVAGSERGLWVLMGAVAFVLLVACANLANLLLARGTARRHEVELRRALGASRLRLLRQVLTESLLLSMTGAAAGVLLGRLFLSTLLTLVPDKIPRLDEVGLDPTVLAFTLGVALLAGLAFGAFPALQLRRDLGTLRAGARRTSSGGWARSGLVVAEVALAVVLVTGAALLARSYVALRTAAPGFDPVDLWTVRTSLSDGPDGDVVGSPDRLRAAATFEAILARVAALPGVSAAAAVSGPPLSDESNAAWLNRPDRPLPAGATPPSVAYQVATPGYFATAGIRLVAGRLFAETDRWEAPAVLIDEVAAKRYWPGEDPIGKELTLGPDGGWIPPSRIVGVVEPVRASSLALDPPPTVYMPHRLLPGWRWMSLVVRTAPGAALEASTLQSAVRELDSGATLLKLRSYDELVAESVAPTRALALLLGLFAAVALTMAAVGVFGVLSFAVSQRLRELGIRMALGAEPLALRRAVVLGGVAQAGAGVALGLVAALLLGRTLEGLLFGVAASDPLSLAAVAVALPGVAALAAWIPARRAARLDPATVLRAD